MIRQLLDRRVPQFVGLYLVGSWGFLEFLDWAVTRYLLSPTLIDFVVALLLLLLPAVAVIAWRHGAPGADEWTPVDVAVIGLNALVAGVVLLIAFRGAELGRTTTVKLVEDAEGNTVERIVPKADFRRSLLLYDFENESGDGELDWLEHGIGLALGIDLAQDVFLTVVGPEDSTIREWLAERGVTPGEDVPLSLKRDAAQLRGMEFFVAGTVRERGDSLLVDTRLYQTSNGSTVASHEYRTTNPLEVVDRISLDLRRDLDIPDGQLEQSVDLPAAELLSDSPEAFRAIVESRRQLFRDNDPATARQTAEQATALDSTSAMAHLAVADAALLGGDQARAASAVAAASRYAYRLPERIRLALQVQNQYLFEGDIEAATRAGGYWTEIYPQDVEARRLLAAIYASAGNVEGQIRQLRALLSIDSTDVSAMRSLAAAFTARAEYDSAIAYYGSLRERRPGDLAIRLELAGALISAGRFSDARNTLAEAAVVGPGDPDVPRQLALLDLRTGDVERAVERLEEVRSLERTPAERERRAALEESIHYRKGQFSRLEDAYRRRLALLAESQPQIQVVNAITNSEYLQFADEGGRADEALAQIDSLRRNVQEPWSLLLEYPAVRIHLGSGDVEAARASLAGVERFASVAGTADFRLSFIAWIQGRIAELEDGNCARAIDFYERALRLSPQAPLMHVSRLECLTELRRWNEAEDAVAWLAERYPARPTYRLAVARYYVARGRTEEAASQLRAALDVWSDADAEYRPAREARELLERLEREPG